MDVAKLLAPDLQRVLDVQPEGVADALDELHAEDLAEIVAELPEPHLVKLVSVLPVAQAADVLSRIDEELSARVLAQLDETRAVQLLSEMSADDRADIVQQLEEPERSSLFRELEKREPEVAEETRALAAFDEDTAGGIMTTEYVAIAPHMTVGQALLRVRRVGREHAEVVYYAYVVDDDGQLMGVVSLRDLWVHDDDARISDIMTSSVVHVNANVDQEEVARSIAKYDLTAIPVVDDDGKMLGVVTIDDVVDVIHEEASEDAQKMAGVVPMEHSYFETGFVDFVRSRITWLSVLFVGELLTATVMARYEADLAAMIDLVIFIPLIISSGGNSGSQSSSLIIRALALGEMTPRDWPRVLAKEAGIGLTLGAMLGLIGFARAAAFARADAVAMGITVASAVVAVVTLGTLVGSLMPLAIKRIGLDPAVSSTPFVASLVDVLGLIVYFTVAGVVFAFAF